MRRDASRVPAVPQQGPQVRGLRGAAEMGEWHRLAGLPEGDELPYDDGGAAGARDNDYDDDDDDDDYNDDDDDDDNDDEFCQVYGQRR
ncbi:hypothetical protein LOZ61_006504 [Ophidiomyces ophidiicola]|nr:hypothetical protein LOZ61_006504 [Ophidiomyces ophidiicola]KAI1921264.1 hypothetical protein LOZ60_006239 [Ophidiomyces ophidiicola]KAI1958986.1 hypothetical protein LOZ59_003295 [Ophidiomyces ophidiicola]KAI2016487.1 hypothetical protein LOZ45_006666 [Ophidiomyces ophidiicola]KAI2143217.1 hypothetical protein LOZ27_003980 [Ophidiomyces ophidiicola]